MVYVKDVASTENKAVEGVVVFQVGTQRIDVKLGEAEAVDAAAQLAADIKDAIGGSYIGTVKTDGNKIYATGNYHYLGKPFDGEEPEDAYRHSVAYELQVFLGKLHDKKDGETVKYPIVRYNSVDYTWHQATGAAGDFSGYRADGGTGDSLISVLVEASKAVFPTYKEGTWTVDMSVNGLPIQFVVTISERHGEPSEA